MTDESGFNVGRMARYFPSIWKRSERLCGPPTHLLI